MADRDDSAALPDVRALIARAKRGTISVELTDELIAALEEATKYRENDPQGHNVTNRADALEAALRSREGERHTSVYRMIGDREVECCSLTMRPVSEGGCPHGSREGERGAQRATDFASWHTERFGFPPQRPRVGTDYDVTDMEAAWAAAQRAKRDEEQSST